MVDGQQEGDGQEYKRAFNTALETAKTGQQAYNGDQLDDAESAFMKAHDEFMQASQLAAQAEDEKVANKASYVAAQLAYKAGLIAAKQEDFDAAAAHFDKGITVYPKYVKNYLGKAKALKDAERIDEAMEAYAAAIEAGNQYGDYETASTAREQIRGYYVFAASQQLAGNNVGTAAADRAIEHLNAMQEYVDADANTYYYLATANEAKGAYDEAIAMADKALELHNGSKSDKAKIYYVKGQALMKQGDSAGARAAFENATYGEYKESSQHFIEQLGNTR